MLGNPSPSLSAHFLASSFSALRGYWKESQQKVWVTLKAGFKTLRKNPKDSLVLLSPTIPQHLVTLSDKETGNSDPGPDRVIHG